MVVTVGFFDGVHVGHRRVLRFASESSENSAVVTFWPHPRQVLGQDADKLKFLSTAKERDALLRLSGIGDIRCLDFTPSLALMTASDFIRNILIGSIGCTHLVLGYDNHLGSDRLTAPEVSLLCGELGLKVDIVPAVTVDDIYVSSTRIRQLLSDGEVELADKMLGYRYPLCGDVVPGNVKCMDTGLVTVTMQPRDAFKAVPANGTYAVDVKVGEETFRGMTNIGCRPTENGGRNEIVTNIFDYDGDLAGREITLEFIARLRDEKLFDSMDDLKAQLRIDKFRCYGFN